MPNGHVVIDIAPQNHEIRLYRDIAGIGLINELGNSYRDRGYDVEYWFILDYMTEEQFERCKSEARNYLHELNEKYRLNINPIKFVDETRVKETPDKYKEYLQPFLELLEEIEPVLESGRLSCTAAETVIYRDKIGDKQNTICITGYPEFYAKLYKGKYGNVEKILSEKLNASIFSFIYPGNEFDNPYLGALHSLYYIYHNERNELDSGVRRNILSTVKMIGQLFEPTIYAKTAPKNKEEFIKWILRSIRSIERKFFSKYPEALVVANTLLRRELNIDPNGDVPDSVREVVKELYKK